MKCRLCGKTAHECGGWLERVNKKGVPGIWECRPNCDEVLSKDDAVILAIQHPSESPSWDRHDGVADGNAQMIEENDRLRDELERVKRERDLLRFALDGIKRRTDYAGLPICRDINERAREALEGS